MQVEIATMYVSTLTQDIQNLSYYTSEINSSMKCITNAARVQDLRFCRQCFYNTHRNVFPLFIPLLVTLRRTNLCKKSTTMQTSTMPLCTILDHFFYMLKWVTAGGVVDPVTCPFVMLTGSNCHRKRRQRPLANSQITFINNTVIIYSWFLSKREFAEFGKLCS